jgi:hypothetical protein
MKPIHFRPLLDSASLLRVYRAFSDSVSPAARCAGNKTHHSPGIQVLDDGGAISYKPLFHYKIPGEIP